jgi:hypothetical protein
MSEQIETNLPPFIRTEPLVATTEAYGILKTLQSSRRLLVVVFMLVIFAAASRPIKDPDFYWHLKTGQYLLENKSIPHTDIFSTSKFGSEWVTHEWLSELFMYSIFRLLGYAGLVVAFAAIITATFYFAYRCCKEVAPHPYVAGFALIVGAAATTPTWGVRPQMLSMLFASIFVLVLRDYCRNGRARAIWLLVPLTVLWVNMHAGFAMGLAFIVLTIMSLLADGLLLPGTSIKKVWPAVRKLCFLLVACIGAVCLNPNGARMYSYPFETLTSSAMMQYIQEWKSPNFHEPMFQALALLLLVTFAVLALSGKRARPGELLMLLVTALATLRSSRNVPFFALLAIPLLAEHSWQWLTAQPWGQWFTKPETRESGKASTVKLVLNVVILLITPLSVVAFRVGDSVRNQFATEADNYPAAAVNYIVKERPAQPIYNEYEWGGYLIWRLYPEYRVNMDGRADVYGDALMEEFLSVHDGETKWRELLDKQGIRTVLVNPNVPLASLLRQDSAWQKVFEDERSVIFVKTRSS